MATLAPSADPHQTTRSLAAQALGSLLYLDQRSLDGMNRRLDVLRKGIVEPQCSAPTGRR